jgi:hypothetical protein
MPYLLCLFIPVADLLLAILYRFESTQELNFIRLIYFFSIYISGIGYFYKKKYINKTYKYIIIYIAFIVIYSFYSLLNNVNIKTVVFSAGTLILPIALFAFGFSKFNNINSVEFIFSSLISLSVISAIFGIWESHNTDFWINFIEFPKYLTEVKGIAIGLEPTTGLPWNFFTDVNPDVGRRSAGLLAAPLAQGIFLSFGFVSSIAYFFSLKKPVYFFTSLITGYGLYSTGTRGAISVAIFALLGIIYSNNFFIRNKLLKIFIIISSAYLIYILFGQKILDSINFQDGSTIGHWDAFILNLTDFSKIILFGIGVGLHGANSTNDQTQIIGGGEGAIFSIAYQIGLPGALVFIYLYYLIIREIYLIRFLKLPKKVICISYVIFWLAIGLIITFITSEHILTLSGMSFFWILCGSIASLGKFQNHENNGL